MKVKKTYKLFINGQFPRTESGRYFQVSTNDGIVNISRASRKDIRDAVVAARTATSGWNGKTAYNRGQILYRIAEVLDGSSLVSTIERSLLVDLLIWYAGWADKISTLFSSVNQVNGPYLNFTVPESVGVVGIVLSKESNLLDLITLMMSAIVSGNTVVLMADSNVATNAIDFAELLNVSDIPAGVVNILTCDDENLYQYLSTHMDVNAIVTNDQTVYKQLRKSTTNLKRIYLHHTDSIKQKDPYWILDTMEMKTVWHPLSI